jgi:hypothetical protein
LADDKKKNQVRGDMSLSHRDAITADFGADALKGATEVGYDGYVWEEDKTQYTQKAVVDNDQTGPLKSVEQNFDPMEAHFIRGDKLDEKK